MISFFFFLGRDLWFRFFFVFARVVDTSRFCEREWTFMVARLLWRWSEKRNASFLLCRDDVAAASLSDHQPPRYLRKKKISRFSLDSISRGFYLPVMDLCAWRNSQDGQFPWFPFVGNRARNADAKEQSTSLGSKLNNVASGWFWDCTCNLRCKRTRNECDHQVKHRQLSSLLHCISAVPCLTDTGYH